MITGYLNVSALPSYACPYEVTLQNGSGLWGPLPFRLVFPFSFVLCSPHLVWLLFVTHRSCVPFIWSKKHLLGFLLKFSRRQMRCSQHFSSESLWWWAWGRTPWASPTESRVSLSPHWANFGLRQCGANSSCCSVCDSSESHRAISLQGPGVHCDDLPLWRSWWLPGSVRTDPVLVLRLWELR